MINKKIILILILSSLLLSNCNKKNDPNELIRPVVVYDLNSEKNINTITYPGIVSADNDTMLAFKVPGNIIKMNVIEGQKVKKNDVIATLSENDYNINYEANQQQLQIAKANYENMIKQYDRAKILYEGKAMSSKNFDIVTAQYKAAKANYLAARQGVKNAKNKISDTQLVAPFDGYIGKKIMDIGSVVNAGTPVVSIISEGKLKVKTNIAEKSIENIKNTSDFVFYVNNIRYKLKLLEIGKSPDLLSLSYPVTFEIETDINNTSLIIGQTGNIVANIKNITNEIQIPVSAILEKDGTFVYIYIDGIAKIKKVKLGEIHNGGMITILEGLDKNDKVITAGVHTIEDGQKVKIIEQSSKTNIGDVL